MRKGVATLIALSVAGCCLAQRPVDSVDPFIGTTNFGSCNPGAVCPNGMMSVVPFNVMGSAENLYDKDACWWSTTYEFRTTFSPDSRTAPSAASAVPSWARCRP